jgi:hypothetical protein
MFPINLLSFPGGCLKSKALLTCRMTSAYLHMDGPWFRFIEHFTELSMIISYNLGRCISYIPIFSKLLVAVLRHRRKPEDTWIRRVVAPGACQIQIRSLLAKLVNLLSISQYNFPSKNLFIKARLLIMKEGSANRFVKGGRRLDRSGELSKPQEKSPQEIGFLLLAFCTKKQLSHETITPLRKHSVSYSRASNSLLSIRSLIWIVISNKVYCYNVYYIKSSGNTVVHNKHTYLNRKAWSQIKLSLRQVFIDM